jgi:uncharacterized membrane protein
MAVLAAIAGLTDVLGDERIRGLNDVWLHAGGNVLGVLIELYSSILVTTIVQQRVGLVLSLIVVLILLFTGWKGWEMVYRHKIGVAN